jgi:uncharacterized protein
MKKTKNLLVLVLAVFCLLCRHGAAAPQYPEVNRQSFFAQDNAKVLTPETINTINKIGEELQAKTKAQVVTVTINSLQGENLEEYATELFRKFGLGDKQTNNGILLLVVVKDHKLRIEVGYGLEGAVTDGYAGSIRDKYLTPAFKKNNFNKGIQEGYIALVQKVAASYKVELTSLKDIPKAVEKERTAEEKAEANEDFWITFGTVALIAVLSVIKILRTKKRYKKLHGNVGHWYDDYGSGSGGNSGGGGSSGGGGASGGW